MNTLLQPNIFYSLLLFFITYRETLKRQGITKVFILERRIQNVTIFVVNIFRYHNYMYYPRSQGLLAVRDLPMCWDTRNRKCKKTCSSL
jgi:hypothetical protein